MTLTADDFLPALSRAQTAEMLRLIGEIDEFKGHWRRVTEVRAERLAQLRQVTTIESTASSTRIEGAELNDAEVARVLEGLHVDSFRARDESEVRGYADLLTLIYDSYAELTLTENHLKQLHDVLLHYSEKDERHRGEYKKLPNHVQATHRDGRQEILFHTASPFDTPRLMAELVAATNEALEADNAHPLVVIARFVVDLLAIHPFQDGNGRLARALTTLLLVRAGYDYVPYSSLERVIEENKQAYYTALRLSQTAMRAEPAEFGAWLLFFLRALRAQKQSLEAKLQVERSMLQLSDVQQRVLEVITTQGRATTPAIASTLGIPRRTVRYHLDVLVGLGMIEAHGERKGRYYTRGTGTAAPRTAIVAAASPGTNAIIADIYERGGRISRRDLLALVTRHGYDGRTVGILHGRRLAHLRRDPKTGQSVLTSRGIEVARQHLFASRSAGRSRG
ncbi:MAG TPA: Fic family protein [Gemmatimonadaceae bacterium]|nr:Fic family protein [Gemmatimonadaceae bacterium]